MKNLEAANLDRYEVLAFVNIVRRALACPYFVVLDVSREDAMIVVPPEGFVRIEKYILRGFSHEDEAIHFHMKNHRPTFPLKVLKGDEL